MEYKECSFGKIKTYREVWDSFIPNHKEFYENPTAFNIEPFKIFGNLYYVGDKMVCMHLIDTGAGLILFDSGFSNNYDSLISSIEKLGFSPKDIKIVIHSHGHFDHFGGGDRLRDRYGATIYMSEVDTNLIKEMPERALMYLAPDPTEPICYPDKTIKDGEVIKLGNTQITCKLAPGHTHGTMAFFFDAVDGEKTLRVGYWGGVGFLTLYKEYLQLHKFPLNTVQIMKDSIKKMRAEKVDIVIGNHPAQNCTLEKRAFMLENPDKNPFINPKAWGMFLDALEERRLEFENKGY